LTAVLFRTLPSHYCILGSCVGGAGEGGDPFTGEDPFDGSDPGEDDDPSDREDPFDGSDPGEDDDPFEGSEPAEDGDAMLPFAAKPFEQPASISATVARAASDRSFLLMFLSCVW
jgi:hypothetical protein